MEFLMPQLWTANISSRDGGKDSKIDLSLSGCRLLKWVEILVHIISLQLGHDISRLVHGDHGDQSYLPQPFLNMTENEYKKKSFARFWHWTICWRIKIFSKITSADLSLKHTLHFLGWVFVFNLFIFFDKLFGVLLY